ncbi:MAG: hypothetical protein NTZ78_03330 [Candidatus Aureabacteria bacterium]|nr:hypothetical protein [Candidatus Auribacterota bacterium]
MKKLITVALSLLFVVCLSYTVIAGSLDSPGAPSAGSGMYTLQNLYDYLTSGTALTVQSSFQEPTSSPGSTMKSTKEIGDNIKAKFDLCATTTAANVESGKPFFCTQPGSWGVQTGTGLMQPTPTITPTNTPSPTPTPVWDSVECTAKGGYWSLLGGGLSGSGCWFSPSSDLSCTATCSAISGLECDPRNWDDSSTCTVCVYFRNLWGIAGTTCKTVGTNNYYPWLNRDDGNCHYGDRTPGSCGYTTNYVNGRRQCVCRRI